MEKTLETGTSMIDLPVSILNVKGANVPISVSTAVLKNDRGEDCRRGGDLSRSVGH